MVIKRRRTHGYAIFSSEMRKKMGDAIPLSETTRVIAEKWRNADAPTRQAYEARAAKGNSFKIKRKKFPFHTRGLRYLEHNGG